MNQGCTEECSWYSCFHGERCHLVVKMLTVAKHLDNHIYRMFQIHTINAVFPHKGSSLLPINQNVFATTPQDPVDRWKVITAVPVVASVMVVMLYGSVLEFYNDCRNGKVWRGPCKSRQSRSSSQGRIPMTRQIKFECLFMWVSGWAIKTRLSVE